MNNNIQISCSITTTDSSARLGLEIWLDNTTIFESDYIKEEINFTYDLNDDDGEHDLKFIMKNKTSADTIIDSEGNIVKDARLIISDLSFDEIELKHLFVEQAVYTHNFNNTSEEIQDQFYGEMGCNGTVSLKFTTPMYMWLLENM